MNQTLEAIKQLREKTGAGIMDCRRALESANGEINMAIAALKEQGFLQAQKRRDRETSEGRVFLKSNRHKAVLLQLACETDFVARNNRFIRLGEECLALAFDNSAAMEALSSRIEAAISRIKENIVLRSLKTLRATQDERIFTYVHGEGRICAALSLSVSDPVAWEHTELQKMATDLTLHVAAFGPVYLSRESVDARHLEEKKQEYLSDAKALGKPDRMVTEIVRGKMNKHLSEICLLDQGFIREEKSSVRQVLDRLRTSGGPDIQVRGFLYEHVGR